MHKFLFRSIRDVLGDAVTPKVAAAWDEVYWLMARALIAQEARLYQEAGGDPRKPWRQWTVVERREETPDVVSFLLRPADGGPVPKACAGQYVSVRVPVPDGVHQTRQYSLSRTVFPREMGPSAASPPDHQRTARGRRSCGPSGSAPADL
ncbi:Flavohemoprotein [Streptomyces sp. enrichment culture]